MRNTVEKEKRILLTTISKILNISGSNKKGDISKKIMQSIINLEKKKSTNNLQYEKLEKIYSCAKNSLKEIKKLEKYSNYKKYIKPILSNDKFLDITKADNIFLKCMSDNKLEKKLWKSFKIKL